MVRSIVNLIKKFMLYKVFSLIRQNTLIVSLLNWKKTALNEYNYAYPHEVMSIHDLEMYI